jgi:hypothetical protein
MLRAVVEIDNDDVPAEAGRVAEQTDARAGAVGLVDQAPPAVALAPVRRCVGRRRRTRWHLDGPDRAAWLAG